MPLQPLGALAAGLLRLAGGSRPLVHVARDAARLDAIAQALRDLAPSIAAAVYPEWDCLPYDRTSPSRAVMGARAGVLRWLTDADHLPDILLTTAPALIQRVAPASVWASAHLELAPAEILDLPALTASLRRLGYTFDDRVDEPGEFAVRGRTIDIFPAAAPRPCRVEHDGARITTIRSYDPLSQRSLAGAERLVVDPATEIVPDEGAEEWPTPFKGQEHGLARHYPALARSRASSRPSPGCVS